MIRIIDAHTHVFPEYADLAVRVMDRCGVERSVTLEWHDGFGETLSCHLAAFGRYPGRFTVFGNVDFARINETGFGAAAAGQLERDVAAGMRGLKIYKALGLEYRHPDGSFWRVDDERLDLRPRDGTKAPDHQNARAESLRDRLGRDGRRNRSRRHRGHPCRE